MRLAIEKLNRRRAAKARQTQIGRKHAQGRRQIRSVYTTDERGREVVKFLHATKGWRVRRADRLPVAW